jgi:chitin synthase
MALPIWNFVLPVYSFWHFDDFTWGQTRKVAGEKKERHGAADGEFDSSQITMKKWEDWERERLGQRKVGIHGPHRNSLITPTTSPVAGLDNKSGVIQDAYADRRMYGTASRSILTSPISYRPSSTINVPPSPRQGPVSTGPRYSQPQPGGGSPYLTATTVSPQAPIAHRLSAPNLEEVSLLKG